MHIVYLLLYFFFANPNHEYNKFLKKKILNDNTVKLNTLKLIGINPSINIPVYTAFKIWRYKINIWQNWLLNMAPRLDA